MKKSIYLLVLTLAVIVSCSKSKESPYARSVGEYAVVTVPAPDLSGISDNGKQVLKLYLHDPCHAQNCLY